MTIFIATSFKRTAQLFCFRSVLKEEIFSVNITKSNFLLFTEGHIWNIPSSIKEISPPLEYFSFLSLIRMIKTLVSFLLEIISYKYSFEIIRNLYCHVERICIVEITMLIERILIKILTLKKSWQSTWYIFCELMKCKRQRSIVQDHSVQFNLG